MILIGIAGKAGSGKSTVAGFLVSQYGFQRLSFAEPLKEMLLKAGICSRDELYVKKSAFSRWIMQKVGTDIFRNQIDPDFWVKKMAEKLNSLDNDSSKVVIDDVRFLNEASLVKQHGGVIVKIERALYSCFQSDIVGNNQHVSETEMELIQPDFVIHNTGTLDDLLNCTSMLIERLFLRNTKT
jgi:dephospho-CoA kinase